MEFLSQRSNQMKARWYDGEGGGETATLCTYSAARRGGGGGARVSNAMRLIVCYAIGYVRICTDFVPLLRAGKCRSGVSFFFFFFKFVDAGYQGSPLRPLMGVFTSYRSQITP